MPCRLKFNFVGAEGAEAIADTLRVNGSLTSLRLDSNKIGPEGAKAIGDALSVNASLTKLDVRFNPIASEAALQEAVKGRDGFELLVS